MLSEALGLWTTVKPYSGFPCQTIAWRLLPAIEAGKCRLFHRDGECVGLITWSFMTSEEFETRVYDGSEIFVRDDGDCLVCVDLIAPHGRKDVVWICREMRRLFAELYPWVETVHAHRGKGTGVFPNAGVWHEDVS